MAGKADVFISYGGQAAYRVIHEAMSKALAEPSAQGNNAHGARAAFLLTEIAPQVQASAFDNALQVLEVAGLPAELLAFIAASLPKQSPRGSFSIAAVAQLQPV